MGKKDKIAVVANFWRVVPFGLFYKHSSKMQIVVRDVDHWWRCLQKNENPGFIMKFREICLRNKEFRNLVLSRGRKNSSLSRFAFQFFFPPMESLQINTSDIGERLFVQHGIATIVSAKSIGDDCWINQQVTIGWGFAPNSPVLGNGVRVCAGAKIIGEITMGDDSIAAANASVVKDVPAGEVWGGVPARRIGTNTHLLPNRKSREIVED